jgi:type I restriction enzyme S subunit
MALSGFVTSLAKGIRERSTDFRWSDAGEIFLPVPSTEEQTQIARFLDHETDRIDILIAEQQRLIGLLKEKRQAVISHAVTKGLDPTVPMKDSGVEWLGEVPAHWTTCRVKTIASFITSGPRGWSDYIDESGTDIFLQSGDLDDRLNVNFKNANRITSPEGAEGVRTRIHDGDVLVCITGANTGRVGVVYSSTETAIAYVNQHLGLVRPASSACYSRYLGYSLSSVACQSYFGVEQYGLKVGLSLTDLAEAPLAIPPLLEQIQIIKQMETQIADLEKLEADADIAIKFLQERRSALISAAVTGKIDVRGWQAPANAPPAPILEAAHG